MNAAISWRSQECSTAWILISSSRHLIFLVHRVANTMVQSIIPPSHGKWGDPLSTLPLKNPPRTPSTCPSSRHRLQAPRTPIRCETFDWFGLQNISISVFGQVTIIAHVRMSSHFLQSWGAAPARWAGGAEGTPSAWDNFMCAMDTEEHTGTWRFPMSVTFMYPLCHSQQPKETSLCSPPAFIFNLLLEKLKISGQEILPCLSTVTISMAWRAVEQCVQNKEKQLHLHYS